MKSKIDLYKLYHQDKNKYVGDSFKHQQPYITALINETKSRTLLDYGCGKGEQYLKENLQSNWNFKLLALYDPAVPKFSKLPKEKYDMIYSTDVMEHIPEKEIQEVFKYIFSHATKCVFLGICTRPAIAKLPNGENAHCTLKPIEWWEEKVKEHSSVYTHLKCYGNSNGYKIINKEK